MNTRWKDAVGLIDRTGKIDNINELNQEFGRHIGAFGFSFYSCAGFLRHGQPFEYQVLMDRLPQGFLDSYQQECLDIDPSLRSVVSTNKCLVWSEFQKGQDDSDDAFDKILAVSGRFGMEEGLTIPIHHPGDYSGVVMMGGSKPEVDQEAVLLMQMLAIHCHDRALEILGDELALARRGDAPDTVRLTSRERECVGWVAEGKSDWDISEILGISQSTAHFHIENAKKKLNVRTRVQLVVSAINRGEISL